MVKPGDRIAQLVIAPVAIAELEEAESLADSDRGGGRLRPHRPLVLIPSPREAGRGLGYIVRGPAFRLHRRSHVNNYSRNG